MDEKTRKSLSKFMSLILRHEPEKFGLHPDSEGYVKLDEFVKVIAEEQSYIENKTVALSSVHEVVAKCDKQRFEINGNKIRTRYGHSIQQKITYPAAKPPEILYHGTSSSTIDEIKKNGLKPMNRQYVHLSVSREIATNVGSRHGGTTLILTISAKKAHEDGIKFFQPEERLFLVESLPYKYVVNISK